MTKEFNTFEYSPTLQKVSNLAARSLVPIKKDYHHLIDRLQVALPALRIDRLYLPEIIDDGEYRDEFGFVVLSDGSVGPFYVSLQPVLEILWRRHGREVQVGLDPFDAARGIGATDFAEAALALGAFNALSRSLMRRAGFEPPDRPASKEASADRATGPVGMVGYFCPVIDRLVAQGEEVLLLEQVPERVPIREHVRVTADLADLAGCNRILCTASVLINDSLDQLLAASAGVQGFEIIGPSGSGLPDALFKRGITGVGGIVFDDAKRLFDALDRRENWGSAGRKYQLGPGDYPGIEVLIAQAV